VIFWSAYSRNDDAVARQPNDAVHVVLRDYSAELQTLFSIIEDDKLSADQLDVDLEKVADYGCFPTNPDDADFSQTQARRRA
jgi:hypothetical protein